MKAACLLAAAVLPCAACALSIDACVGTDAITVGAGERHAFLGEADRAAMVDAIGERFPVLQRAGFAPSQLLLWDRPGRGWVYVALTERPDKRDGRCFTASVSAAAVPATRQLLPKYFPDRPA